MEWITQSFRKVFLIRAAAINAATYVLFSVVVAFSALQPKTALAQPCIGLGGWVVSVEGNLTISSLPAQMGDEFCLGEEIIVGQQSRAAIRLAVTQTVVRAKENSTFVVEESDNGGSLLKMLEGVLYLFSRRPQSLSIKTPYINAAIDGTEFVIESSAERSEVTVIEGNVRVSNGRGTVRITPGEAANVSTNGLPERRTVVDPLNAAQWALYYPSIGAAENTTATVRSAAESLARGDTTSAENALAALPEDAASLSLQSIIAVSQNNSNKAIELARSAVSIDASSSLAYSALSYAQQSQFDIDKALSSAIMAVQNDSTNANALARQAELQLGVDQTTEALASAREAVRVDSKNSRARTILGFVNLVRLDVREAKAAFSDAVFLDPGDPLPRMGLGLAVIRDGLLVEGREHIEVAASLDPANALIRSYLGKAYFEERETADANAQFALAQQLDPKDPTPWFYDAILLQSLNQPSIAYQKMSKAISLNNNQLIYKSRVLVDKSAAASTLGLANIYDDLGFQQLAVNEGAKAIVLDFNNYSAHRFLADSYAQRERHETARKNLLYQSALLQPMTINSVQPESLGTDRLLLPAAGLSRPSINEYTPLFDRKSLQVSGSLFGGSQQTLGDELVLAGLADHYTFSLGQFHYETDGFRINNDLSHDIININFQIQASPAAFIHAGYTKRETNRGDLSLSIAPDTFSQEDRFRQATETPRLGLRFVLAPNSTVVMSARRVNRSEEALIPGDSTQEFDLEGYQAHVRYNYKKQRSQHVIGLEAYDISSNTNILFDNCDEEPCNLDLGSVKSVFGNLFYYMDFLQNNVQWTLGSSVTSLDDDELLLTTKVNPRIGLRWQIADSHELRLAASVGTQKRNAVDRTLEPIVLAGFNQLYDDAAGSRYRNGGIGYDWNTNDSTKTGIELVYRDIDIPRVTISGDGSNSLVNINEPQREFNLRAYIYKIINPQISVGATLLLEDFDRTVTATPGGTPYESFPAAVKTLSSKFNFRFTDRTGIYLESDTSYVSQGVDVLNPLDESSVFQGTEFKQNDFWNFNVGVGYKLKSRRGAIQVDVVNIFDKPITYQDQNIQTLSISNPRYSPERSISARLSFVFP